MKLVIVAILTFIIFVIISAFSNRPEVKKDFSVTPAINHPESKPSTDSLFLFKFHFPNDHSNTLEKVVDYQN